MNLTREEAIKNLENNLERIFSYVKNDESFHTSVVETYRRYKDYYKDLPDCYDKTIESYERSIYRYSGSLARGYESYGVESLLLENRLWSYAENNPEHWYLMTEKIAYNDQSANIFTPDGFSFMDNFIHNGIYDDWCLGLASKNDIGEYIFFNNDSDDLKQEYLDNGYEVAYVNESTVKKLLNKLENITEPLEVPVSKKKMK